PQPFDLTAAEAGILAARAGAKSLLLFHISPRYHGSDLMHAEEAAKQFVDQMEQALRTLHSHAGFTLLENGLLVVTFEDRDPEKAAAILNRMIVLLDELNRELNITRASRMRLFIEGQLEEREDDLAAAEDALNRFQEEHRALDLEKQLTVTMDIVSDLTARAISLETELDILSYYTSKTSEEYVRLRREYEEVVEEIGKLKIMDAANDEDVLRTFIPSLKAIPGLALEMLRLQRRVEIESSVYAMLITEYETARFEEARDMPTLQVLDAAQPPGLRSRPRRKLFVLAGLFLGIAWGSMIALFVTAWRENRERSAVIQDILGPLASDFRRIVRRH
ncbi:MAG: hypothetical protein IH969_00460, partial [Candidatus Krumholzibacteriota bacterium]|nr:hypothetical protein [Candidatus Krumholzibacteriota bacterium]